MDGYVSIKFDYLKGLHKMPESECGGIVHALYEYFVEGREPQFSTYAQEVLWEPLSGDIERAMEAREKLSEINSEKGKKSGQARAARAKEPRLNRDEPRLNRDEPQLNRDDSRLNRDDSRFNKIKEIKEIKEIKSLSQKEKKMDGSTGECPTDESASSEYGECEDFPDKDFETFWNAYPRKESRGYAEKAFEQVLSNGVTLQNLLDGISRARGSRKWNQDGGQFIPSPATWLMGKGWLDGYEDAGAGYDSDDDITV